MSGSQPGMILLPLQDIFQCLEIFLVVTNGGVLLASNGQRPEMVLNILQCTAQPHNDHLAENISSAEAEKP